MNSNELCSTVGRSLLPLFVCSEAEPEGVRVRTPMLYPDGGVVDVFVLTRGDGYVVTDFGDALGWLWLQSVSPRRSARQEALARDVCQTLRIELFDDQLVARGVTQDALGEAVIRIAQAAVQVSDRGQAFQTAADNNRGVAKLNKGDYDGAIEPEPNEASAYSNRGEIWLHLSEWDNAREDLAIARNRGVDIVASFRNDYESVADFEQRNDIAVPADIAEMLGG